MHLEVEKHHEQISETVMLSSVAQKYLVSGRVVVVKSQSVSLFPQLEHVDLLPSPDKM